MENSSSSSFIPRASVISVPSIPFLSVDKTDERKEVTENLIGGKVANSLKMDSGYSSNSNSNTAVLGEKMGTSSDVCSNCNTPFSNKDDRITLVYIDGLCQNISIAVALAFVYESRGKDPNALEESVFLHTTTKQNSQFPLCLSCSCSLRSLYQAFIQFNQLRNLESLISKTLEEIPEAESVKRELVKRKPNKECENDSFSLLNIKIEADDCLTNLEDLIDSSFDPNIVFPEINSDSEGFEDDGEREGGYSDSNDEIEKKLTRPRRNVARKRYSDVDYDLDSPDGDPGKISESSSESDDDRDEDFKPAKYIEDKIGNKLSKRTKKTKKEECTVKIKEEPLDEEDVGEDSSGEGKGTKKKTDKLGEVKVRKVLKLLPKAKGESGLFYCTQCPKGFKSLKNLKRHVRIHVEEYDSLLTCQICQKKFSRKEHLTRHVFNIHENKKEKAGSASDEKKPERKKAKEIINFDEIEGEQYFGAYPCTHCSKVLKSSDSLRRHVRVHTDEDNSRLICKICNRKFTREHHLSRHSSAVHGQVLILEPRGKKKSLPKLKRDVMQKCPVCSESLIALKRSEFKEHVKSHGVENPWTCSQCGKAYAEVNRLRQHMARVHHEGRATYNCDICDLSFGFKHILSQHQAELHTVPNNVDVETLELMAATILSNSENKSSYVCSVCSKEYSRKERLTTHMLKHTQYAPHSCELCGKKFLLERSLKIHALLHNSHSPYVCEVCNRRFARADHLKRHLEVKHKDGKRVQHVCDVCGKEYNQLHKLKMHQITHTDERPWSCDKCDKRFNHPSSLLAHKTTHTEERKFCCSTCGRTFKRWCHLRDHEALHADNIPRPFPCTVPGCGKTFKRAKDLRNHNNVHSGIKDNICEICGAAFNRIDNLRAHVKAIHLKDESVRRRPNKRKSEQKRDTVVKRPKNRDPPPVDLQLPNPMPVTPTDYLGYPYPYLQPFPHPPHQH